MASLSVATKPPAQDLNPFGDMASASVQGRPDYRVGDPLAPVSGYTNYTPAEMRTMSTWLDRIRGVYQLYGFTGIVTPPFEYAENLLKKGGVTHQIYGVSRLQDGGLTKLGVPFDRTVPTALFVARNLHELAFPYKRFSIEYSCRGEHAVANKGRYRAFYQADIDTFDRKLTPGADAETIAAMVKGLESVGVDDCNVYLNHVLIAKAFVEAAGVPKEQLDAALRIIDKLKPDNRPAVVAELMEVIKGMDEESAQQLLENMNYRGPVSDFRFALAFSSNVIEALQHLREIEATCIAMGVKKGTIQFCTSLTRGLDYYTGVVFETFIPGKERFGSIASGGRYDDLVDGFSDKAASVKGVGGSIGVTRLFDVMKELGRLDLSKQTAAQVFVGYRIKEEGCYEKALELATALRAQGITVELYTGDKIGKKWTNQMSLCNQKGIPCSVMVMNENEIVVKDMRVKATTAFENVGGAVAKVVALAEAGIFEERVNRDVDDRKDPPSKPQVASGSATVPKPKEKSGDPDR